VHELAVTTRVRDEHVTHVTALRTSETHPVQAATGRGTPPILPDGRDELTRVLLEETLPVLRQVV